MQHYFWTLSQEQTNYHFSSILLYWSTFQLKGSEQLSRYSDWLRDGTSGNGMRWWRDFSHTSRLALGPTQPLSPGGKAARAWN